ncbi:hypothetical protein BAUCODRAFT_33656 [Baudoinia panamericana UAMH 10762]|uniref:Uncharacterized protein n=1 Tax=Baudoinia panamericana (strain UAMH 10762) TaxID=717646 RepID=M2LPJ4_BAUPA|nr:uncharacterized protein BAUCODRAFT_33656 [Baudoinia panamericana UAMH 10762]EMC96317.1 hypothetical protein BAUCODRAFT_33656 [Baudoinia panamericana UAMH 10762]
MDGRETTTGYLIMEMPSSSRLRAFMAFPINVHSTIYSRASGLPHPSELYPKLSLESIGRS